MPLESKEAIAGAEFLHALSFPLPLSHADPICMVLYPHLPLSSYLSLALPVCAFAHISLSLSVQW